MNAARFRTLFATDFAQTLKRPLFLVLLVILGFTAYGLASGEMTISSGDSRVGGTKAWLTSEFAQAQMLSMVIFIFYMFFITIGSGMAVIRDEDWKVPELLRSTRMTTGEYVWAKFWAVMAGFLSVLGVHLILTIFFNHVFPTATAEEIRGPFNLLNYLKPAVIFGVPALFMFGGVAFMMGALTRKPVLVFVFPVALIMVCGFFLWNWSPTWLDPQVNKILQYADPGGFRWLNETWLKVDMGVDYYNQQAVSYDLPFLLSRVAWLGVGFLAVLVTQLRLEAVWRGSVGRWSRKRSQAVATEEPVPAGTAGADLSAELLRAEVKPSRFLPSALHVARFEFKELIRSPGLYLFVPIILVQILGTALTAVGPFSTKVLLVPGFLAVASMNTITLCVCLLLLFYTVESLARDRNTGFGEIFHATPLPTGALLLGKSLANVFVGGVIVVAAFLASWIAMLIQGQVAMNVGPFALVWGLLLAPTFLVWTAFTMALYAAVRNRYMTYALALGALILTGYKQMTGDMNWVGNWNLWGAVVWSDISVLELNRSALIWNRLLAFGLTALFVILAVRFFGRRGPDATRLMHRLAPRQVLKAAVPLLPALALVVVLAAMLYNMVQSGFQADAAEKAHKDYWRANIATFEDAPFPAIRSADISVDLRPHERRLVSRGEFLLRNHREEAMDVFPVTTGQHWENLTWTLNGEPYEPEERAHLYVIAPPGGLDPGDEVTLGWSFDGAYPLGITKNGGGASTFVLPSGVVLTGFEPSFAPVLGYDPSVGVDEDNRSDPKTYFTADFHRGITHSGFGVATAFPCRMTLTGPESFTLNGVGAKVEDVVEDGRRRTVWETDHPIKLFNIVAGEWDVREGEGTALYYHPDHTYNIDEMVETMDAARKYYSEWFYPFPWETLKISEFPSLAAYAQGFPTNITFSEGIGFLSKSDPKANTAFMVTAHEIAHQWWGNLVTPGDGPGGNLLSEGMAHYSTALLLQEVKGDRDRMEFMKQLEDLYGDRRRVDSERPLIYIDGAKPGDRTVTYNKGGWVFWMLMDHLGREPMLAGLREFIAEYRLGPDYPLLQDFVEVMGRRAADRERFHDFARQWFYEVHVPQYKLREVTKTQQADGGWEIAFTLENVGDGRMPVEVAAVRGERFPQEDDREAEAYRSMHLELPAFDGSVSGTIHCSFEPREVVVDPDVRRLQLKRDLAVHRF